MIINREIAKKEYTVKDTGLSYRELSYWAEKGLMKGVSSKANTWNKFQFIDLVEIKIYQELRIYGVSIGYLIHLKKYLHSSTETQGKVSHLKYATFNALQGDNQFLVTNRDFSHLGFYDLNTLLTIISVTQDDPNYFSSLVILNISTIIKGFEKDFQITKPIIVDLAKSLIDPDIQQLNIKKSDDNTIQKIEKTKVGSVGKDTNLIKFLNENKDSKIEFTVDKNGKPHRFKTIKSNTAS